MKSLLRQLSSLKLTLLSLLGLFFIVLFGTFAQVNQGIHIVQQLYFRSFIIWKTIGTISIPIFPGGYVFGGLLLINLCSFFIIKLKWAWKNTGIILIHSGLLLLLIGSGLTGILSVESQVVLEEGSSTTYSDDFIKKELVIFHEHNNEIEMTSIPYSLIKNKSTIELPTLPFNISVQTHAENATLKIVTHNPKITQGIGQYFSIEPLKVTFDPNRVNITSAIIDIISDTHSPQSLLVSEEIKTPQSFQVNGETYQLLLRRKRYYTPYSLTLNHFTHEKYMGTDIPKNFASDVTLSNPITKEERRVQIYMNHPLRYEGQTYYQASFGKNDTVSIFQVVKNPTWLWPYISTILMALGLCIHFVLMAIRKGKK